MKYNGTSERIVAKYWPVTESQSLVFSTFEKQRAFENSIYTRAFGCDFDNQTVIEREGMVVVVQRVMGDSFALAIGEQGANEIVLAEVVQTFHSALQSITGETLTRKSMFDQLQNILLLIDEMVDQGVILHTEPKDLVDRVKNAGESGGTQSAASDAGSMFNQAIASAKEGILKNILG
eukprot:Trichotokara_eunicae@DN5838_c0_g2_i1.p1